MEKLAFMIDGPGVLRIFTGVDKPVFSYPQRSDLVPIFHETERGLIEDFSFNIVHYVIAGRRECSVNGMLFDVSFFSNMEDKQIRANNIYRMERRGVEQHIAAYFFNRPL